MILIYTIMSIMLITALGLLAIPFINNNAFFSKRFAVTALITLAFAMTLYHYNNNHIALKNWYTSGKEHYELLTKFDAMGGVNGMITRINQKLSTNPADPEGWLILGKLYLSQQNFTKAQIAFDKALALNPSDEQIIFYAGMSAKQNAR